MAKQIGKAKRVKAAPGKQTASKANPAKEDADRRKAFSTMFVDALDIAVEAHRGQTDKYDQPYIMHVLGVMGGCLTVEEKIVGLLHDVVEDTDMTIDDLRTRGFTERIVTAVDLLTRRRGENYDHFVERIAPNPLARAVKLADLEDNMDVRRSNRSRKEKDAERMEKYRKAWQKLTALHTGDSQ
jgi:(p)ppGpp synthase/HD superfamily hydrolase